MHRQVIAVLAVLTAATAATAFDLPARKAGLWEIKMSFAGGTLPAQLMTQCIDAASDRLMNSSFAPAQSACSRQDMRKSGGAITVDSVCKFGEATTTSHAVVTGSFDSAYTMQVTSKREGGPALPGLAPGGETHMTVAAKWLGPCAAGQKPGDVIMANGVTMNVIDLQKMKPPVK